jgi:hypothetical protein
MGDGITPIHTTCDGFFQCIRGLLKRLLTGTSICGRLGKIREGDKVKTGIVSDHGGRVGIILVHGVYTLDWQQVVIARYRIYPGPDQ